MKNERRSELDKKYFTEKTFLSKDNVFILVGLVFFFIIVGVGFAHLENQEIKKRNENNVIQQTEAIVEKK